MDPHSFVGAAVLLLIVAAVAVAISRSLGLGSILGLLVTGIIVGPHTPGPFLTNRVDDVRQFTELGVVLLMFLIGLEIKPKRLWDMRSLVFGLGSAQILGSALVIGVYFWSQGQDYASTVILSLSLALSSTAFVVQILREHGAMASSYGQVAFAVLLMQDLAVVPLLSVLPLLKPGGADLDQGQPLWQQIGMALSMIGLVLLSGRYVVPRVLDYFARRKNREGFFLLAMASLFIAALLVEQAGMSMALGAFLMGMMLSTSRYSLQIEVAIEPHKGVLMSLFFVAVGMSIDVRAIAHNFGQFMLDVAAVIVLKVLVLYGLCLLFKNTRPAATRLAFLLAQGGEFGFVVFGAAKASGIISNHAFTQAVAIISLTMLLTPLLAKIGHALAQRQHSAAQTDGDAPPLPQDSHAQAIIAGYGRMGHSIGTILTYHGVPYVAFDSDAATVAKWRAQGHPVYYAHIDEPELLASASLQQAELLILTVEAGPTTLKAAQLVRSHFPHLAIAARARDLAHCDALSDIGVQATIPETLEATLTLAAESLKLLGHSEADNSLVVQGMRAKGGWG